MSVLKCTLDRFFLSTPPPLYVCVIKRRDCFGQSLTKQSYPENYKKIHIISSV